MRIIKNGQEFELTREEMMFIHEVVEARYRLEDIMQRVQDMEYDIPNIEEHMEAIDSYVQKYLSNNDSYWSAYWHTIDYAIEEYMEDNQLC